VRKWFVLRGLPECAVLGMGKWLERIGLRECVIRVCKVGSNEEGEFMGENNMECLLSQ